MLKNKLLAGAVSPVNHGAEGDFYKEIYIGRTNEAKIRQKTRVSKWRVIGRIHKNS